jgi:uncharacterized protein
MLAFNVAQLLKEGVGAFRQLQLGGELYQVDEFNPGRIPVVGQVTLIRTIAGVLATGHAELTLERACRRCLEPVRGVITLEIEEEFVPSIDVVTGRPLPVDSEVGPELLIDEKHSLDLAEVLWQYAVAQTTETVYCTKECLGLCPYCGANLNLGPCGCKTDQIDPRLAALAQLLGSSELDDTIEEGEDE